MSRGTLQLERTFLAPPERVFAAWTSEEVMRRWFFGQPGWEAPVAEVDLRVGGALRVVMRDPQSGREHGGGGTYTEVDPPRRLAFTWIWDEDREDPSRHTRIEIEFEPAGEATRVRFTHSGLWDEEAVRSHESGWSNCFDQLEQALSA